IPTRQSLGEAGAREGRTSRCGWAERPWGQADPTGEKRSKITPSAVPGAAPRSHVDDPASWTEVLFAASGLQRVGSPWATGTIDPAAASSAVPFCWHVHPLLPGFAAP